MKKAFFHLLATTTYSFTACMLLIIMLFVSLLATIGTTNGSFTQFLLSASPWIAYLFLAALCGTGILYARMQKGTPAALMAGLLLAVYVILNLIVLIKMHVTSYDKGYFEELENYYNISMVAPMFFSSAFVLIAHGCDQTSLRIRSYLLMALAIAILVAMIIIKNGSVDSAKSGALGVLIITGVAYCILEAIVFFRWLNIVRNE